MPNAIRYAILDHATDNAPLWDLPLPLLHSVGGRVIEVHPRRLIEEVTPHLLDLLREGHVELYPWDDVDALSLSLEDALSAAADPSNWDPSTAAVRCGVMTTDSGDDEFETERDAAEGGR